MQLVIGNKNYSSWSLRAWLYLTESGIEFEERRLSLFTESFYSEISRLSPAGRVPVLIDGNLTIWDSLAIIEHCREKFPQAVDWPVSQTARAHALSISAQMHSGFLALRDELPQNLRTARVLAKSYLSSACQKQIDQIADLWTAARDQHGGSGPWLYGDFSVADVMFAPVALRFLTYTIPMPSQAQTYMDAVARLPSVRLWCSDAAKEPEKLPFVDELVGSDNSPINLG